MGGDHAEVRRVTMLKRWKLRFIMWRSLKSGLLVCSLAAVRAKSLVSRAAIMDALRLQTLPNPS